MEVIAELSAARRSSDRVTIWREVLFTDCSLNGTLFGDFHCRSGLRVVGVCVCVCVVSEGDVVDKQTGGAGEREREGSQSKYTFLFV